MRAFADPLERYIGAPSRRTFEAMFLAYRSLALRAALRVTGRLEVAEDVAQEVFERLLTRPPVLPLPASPRIYILSLVHQRASEWARDESVRRSYEMDAGRLKVPDGYERAALEIRDAIEGLDERLRSVSELFFLYGYTHEEIGKLLSCSSKTVSRRLRDAREQLRNRLSIAALAALGIPSATDAATAPPVRLDRWAREAAEAAFPPSAGTGLAVLAAKIAACLIVAALPVILALQLLTGDDGAGRAPIAVLRAGGRDLELPREEPPRAAPPARPPAVLLGRVVAWGSEEPVGGASIWRPVDAGAPIAATGEDGRFSIAAGPVTEILVKREGFTTSRVALPASPPGEITLCLVSAVGWSAKIIDAATARPLPGAILRIVGPGGDTVAQATADGEGMGTVALAEIPVDLTSPAIGEGPPAYALEVSAEGFETRRIDEPLGSGPDLSFIRLEAALAFGGVVVDPEGRPVSGAHVLWSCSVPPEPVSSGPAVEETESDETGAFTWKSRANAPSVTLAAFKEGFSPAFLDLEKLPAPGGEPIALRLRESCALHGTAYGADGRPLQGALLELRPQSGAPGPTASHYVLIHRHAGARPFIATTAPDGSFGFADLPAGTYRVHTVPEGILVGTEAVVPCSTAWSGTVGEQAGMLIAVVGPQGTQPGQVNVIALASESGSRPRVVEQGTTFLVEVIDTLPLRLMIVAEGCGSKELEITEPREEFIVMLDRRAPAASLSKSLVVNLSWEGLVPVLESLSVTLTSRDSGETCSVECPARKGRLELWGLPAGRCDIEFKLPGFSRAVKENVSLPSGEPLTVGLVAEE